jgi:hypothetical protein
MPGWSQQEPMIGAGTGTFGQRVGSGKRERIEELKAGAIVTFPGELHSRSIGGKEEYAKKSVGHVGMALKGGGSSLLKEA